jgi:hypothetical protein
MPSLLRDNRSKALYVLLTFLALRAQDVRTYNYTKRGPITMNPASELRKSSCALNTGLRCLPHLYGHDVEFLSCNDGAAVLQRRLCARTMSSLIPMILIACFLVILDWTIFITGVGCCLLPEPEIIRRLPVVLSKNQLRWRGFELGTSKHLYSSPPSHVTSGKKLAVPFATTTTGDRSSNKNTKRIRTDDRETLAPLPALGHSFRESWRVV